VNWNVVSASGRSARLTISLTSVSRRCSTSRPRVAPFVVGGVGFGRGRGRRRRGEGLVAARLAFEGVVAHRRRGQQPREAALRVEDQRGATVAVEVEVVHVPAVDRGRREPVGGGDHRRAGAFGVQHARGQLDRAESDVAALLHIERGHAPADGAGRDVGAGRPDVQALEPQAAVQQDPEVPAGQAAAGQGRFAGAHRHVRRRHIVRDAQRLVAELLEALGVQQTRLDGVAGRARCRHPAADGCDVRVLPAHRAHRRPATNPRTEATM